MIASLTPLAINDEVQTVAAEYIERLLMPSDPTGDALHLALASYHITGAQSQQINLHRRLGVVLNCFWAGTKLGLANGGTTSNKQWRRQLMLRFE